MRSLLLLTLVGCAYKPGSFQYESKTFPGQRVSIGCLDISVDRRADINDDPVLDIQFANRCDEPVTIDLLNPRVVGRTANGVDKHLSPFDPRGEIKVAQLDALQAGGEALAYVSDDPSSPIPFVQLCIDVAQIERTDKARDSRWVCFGQRVPKRDGLVAEVSQ